MLYSEARLQADGTVRMQTGKQEGGFAQFAERAERELDPDKKIYYLATAVLRAAEDESLGRLEEIAGKISDNNIRDQLLDWLYFKRSQVATTRGDFYEARRLADKIKRLDLQSYLSYQMAAGSLKKFDDRARAAETLNAAHAAASKAPNTVEKARSLLGVAHLYVKFDHQRAFEVMNETVKTINRLTSPDLDETSIFQRIEGRGFGHYARFELTGFSLENVFREIAPFDNHGALLLAQALEDRFIRSKAIISVASLCLEQSHKRERLVPKAAP
jgi:hypothetical protein